MANKNFWKILKHFDEIRLDQNFCSIRSNAYPIYSDKTWHPTKRVFLAKQLLWSIAVNLKRENKAALSKHSHFQNVVMHKKSEIEICSNVLFVKVFVQNSIISRFEKLSNFQRYRYRKRILKKEKNTKLKIGSFQKTFLFVTHFRPVRINDAFFDADCRIKMTISYWRIFIRWNCGPMSHYTFFH